MVTLGSPCIKPDIGDWTKVQTVLWAVRWQAALVCQHPPCSIPPSSIWSVADHDPWPPCGVGEEKEDNIPPQKSMYINDAAVFSLIYMPALMNYCVVCCSGSNSTPGWLTQLHKLMQKRDCCAATQSTSGDVHRQIAESSCTCFLKSWPTLACSTYSILALVIK